MTTNIDYTSLAKRPPREKRNTRKERSLQILIRDPGLPNTHVHVYTHLFFDITQLSKLFTGRTRFEVCRWSLNTDCTTPRSTHNGYTRSSAACIITHVNGSYLKSLPILLPLSGIPGSGHILCPWDTPT